MWDRRVVVAGGDALSMRVRRYVIERGESGLASSAVGLMPGPGTVRRHPADQSLAEQCSMPVMAEQVINDLVCCAVSAHERIGLRCEGTATRFAKAQRGKHRSRGFTPTRMIRMMAVAPIAAVYIPPPTASPIPATDQRLAAVVSKFQRWTELTLTQKHTQRNSHLLVGAKKIPRSADIEILRRTIRLEG